jgi:hypothetical protein
MEPNSSFVSPGRREKQANMPLDALVSFGRLGNGDLFGHPVPGGQVREDVFVWDHEDDSRTWYGRDMADALSRFCSNK